ncbi:DotU family type IV/VI secretion system protein [Pandoraea sp. NPDC087047]|uniref:DotU family type IV/VI secretion system protein n=1 Tax=Pandoraea sp. NPDC087047 TaxID=3364390 RepID=UPI00381E2059
MNVIANERAELIAAEALGAADTAARRAPAEAASTGPIRPYMRDAALLVATLTAGGTVPDSVALRERGQTLLDEFDAVLRHNGIAEQVRKEAGVALCALLDETALRRLHDADRAGWELAPLQVQRFGIHDAGERVFAQLEAHLATPTANVNVLEFYSAILGLGFVGRYALLGETQRREFIAELDKRIVALRPQIEPPFVIERTSRRLSDGVHWLSPWAMAGMSCLIAVLVWSTWSAALDAQLSHVAPAKRVPAPHAATAPR